VQRDDVEFGLTFRFGLPLDSQLTLDVPYSYENTSTETRVGFVGRRERTTSAEGLDDISLTFNKTLLPADGLWPNLVGGLTWDSDIGDTEGQFELGSGFNELGTSLVATKRVDPFVYVGGISYLYAFEDDDLQPGSQVGFSIGTVLAVSPETSLRFFLSQNFADELEAGGNEVPGSDRLASTFTVGLSSVLSTRVLLDLALDVGLTDDAADYALRVSLPIRFDLPFRF
jgi:hypothetical protein